MKPRKFDVKKDYYVILRFFGRHVFHDIYDTADSDADLDIMLSRLKDASINMPGTYFLGRVMNESRDRIFFDILIGCMDGKTVDPCNNAIQEFDGGAFDVTRQLMDEFCLKYKEVFDDE